MKDNCFVLLISGRGSNLKAICNTKLRSQIACVISNNPEAHGLEIAKNFGLKIHIINHREYNTREEFEKVLASTINLYSPKLIALAGFMRILTSWFVTQYPNKIINIHPSILPAFVGANAQKDALHAKVKISGATVHFVNEKLDHGPIIAQGIVNTEFDDDLEKLSSRILELEHHLYPFVIQKILDNQLKINSNGYVSVNKTETDQTNLGKFFNYTFY